METSKIIIRPVVTEKSNRLKEEKTYVFQVDPRANKVEIMRALKELFKVHCLSCRIMNVKSKPKRTRNKKGYTASWKKAIVTVRKEEKIDIFEGA